MLVSEMVTNELRAQQEDQTRWMYVSREQQPGSALTKEVIETREGMLSRIIVEDHHPLTSRQQQQQYQHLQHVIQNPSELKKQKKEQEHDKQREQQLLAMMADGFLYEYEGNEGKH